MMQASRLGHLRYRLILALGLTAAADALLYVAAPGLGLTCFLVLTACVLCAAHGKNLLRARGWLAVWAILALNTLWANSVIGVMLTIALSWIVLALSRMPEPIRFFTAVVRGMTGGARSYTLLGSDLRRWALIGQRLAVTRRGGPNDSAGRLSPFWVYALPAGLIAVFALLIIPANLVLGRWVEESFQWVWRMLTSILFEIQFGRLIFWIAVGLGIYGLIRFRLGRHPGHRDDQTAWSTNPADAFISAARNDDGPPADPAHERQACLLTFAGLNLLYLLANLADLFFIWLHVELPAGMTYAQFAHHGSYRLIVAVVLAAVLVPVFFRLGTLASRQPTTRALAYGFILQNLIVLLGAARRLTIYDEVYGLTRFRTATYLWLALVFAGFVLTYIKVQRNKPFRFLVDANAIATVALLTLVGWLNLDGFIADWNVRRYETKRTAIMDVEYLGNLDAGALPALARLLDTADPTLAAKTRAILTRRLAEEKALLKDWRQWTWQRAQAVQQAEMLLKR